MEEGFSQPHTEQDQGYVEKEVLQIVDEETFSILLNLHKFGVAEVVLEIDVGLPLVEIDAQILLTELVIDDVEAIVNGAMDELEVELHVRSKGAVVVDEQHQVVE